MRALRLNLSPEQLTTLRQSRHHADRAFAERCLYVLLNAEQGLSTYQIAALQRRDVRVIRRWLVAYAEQGIDALHSPKGAGGRPRVFRDRVQVVVASLLNKSPIDMGYKATHWTLPLLARVCAEQLGHSVSQTTVRRVLRETGWRYKRARKAVPTHAPDSTEKKGTDKYAA